MTFPTPDTLEWLARLVAFDTTSRGSNLPLLDAVAGHARALGLEPLTFPNADATKANLVVTVPAADGRTDGGIMLAGHVDCVPVDGQAWASDPFTLTRRGERWYGRGTADMKGFCAVALAALPEFAAARLAEPVHLGFTYDEEVGCLGAQPFVDSLAAAGRTPHLAFVGEPTSMRMIRAHKSINVVRVTLCGVAAHSSLTNAGVNAVEYGAEVIRFWRERCDRWRAEGPFDPAYPVPFTTGSVNLVAGGNAVNTVPERCEVTLEFRAIAATDDAAEIAALRAFCAEVEARMRSERPAASVTVEVLAATPGLDAPPDAAAVAFGRRLGLRATDDKVTYGTEAGVYARGGISAVVCGPGDIAQAHAADEYVSAADLAACEAFVGRLAGELRV